MRIFIVLLLSCVPLLGADTDIQVTTTSQTNLERTVVFTQEVFKRVGQTNLVCRTRYEAGKLKVRLQQIYHGGRELAVFTTGPHIFHIETKAGCPYSVTFDYWPSNKLQTVAVWTANDSVVDMFSYKDGILSPVEGSLLRKTLGAKHLEMQSNTALEPTPTAP